MDLPILPGYALMETRRTFLTAMHQVAATLAGNAVNSGDSVATLGDTKTLPVAGSPVNVVEFGADSTGKRDSSDALVRAIQHAFRTSHSRSLPRPLYFPEGRYLLTRSNLFRPPSTGLPTYSWTIFGAGRETSLLIFKPNRAPLSSTYYLYDGLASQTENADQTILGMALRELTIQFDGEQLPNNTKISCFRQFGSRKSGNPEQHWTFVNCSFRGDTSRPEVNGSILEIDGDANGSENSFIGCRGLMFEHVIDCLNPQAVNHLSLFCHWEVIVGDMFRFIRGGNLTLYGGSLIISNLDDAPQWKQRTVYPPGSNISFDGRRFRTERGGKSGDRRFERVSDTHFDGGVHWTFESDRSAYLLRVGGDLTGQINTFLISGARVELRSNRAKLLAGGDLNTGALITFENVAVQPVLGGPRHTIELAESAMSVRFLNCKLSRASEDWDDAFAAAFGPGTNSGIRGVGARILLDGCIVSEQIHEQSVWAEGSNAVITLDRCTCDFNSIHAFGQSSITEVNGVTSRSRGSAGVVGVVRHAKSLLLPFEYWPGPSVEDTIRLSLPPKAIVLTMRFRRANSEAASHRRPYQLYLCDDSGNEVFRSERINLMLPFEISTPRLYSRPSATTFQLLLNGTAQDKRADAQPGDCIIVDWI